MKIRKISKIKWISSHLADEWKALGDLGPQWWPDITFSTKLCIFSTRCSFIQAFAYSVLKNLEQVSFVDSLDFLVQLLPHTCWHLEIFQRVEFSVVNAYSWKYTLLKYINFTKALIEKKHSWSRIPHQNQSSLSSSS